MSYTLARLTDAVFASEGIEAAVTPDSGPETLALGGQHTSGEECLPLKITVGDFLLICRQPGFDPSRTAFFMPSANGPCRFGQYAVYLRRVLADLGYDDVLVFSPSSGNAYAGVTEHAGRLSRTFWMGFAVGELLDKFLHKTRPHERTAGDAEAAFEASLDDFRAILATRDLTPQDRLSRLTGGVERMAGRFRAVPADYRRDRPLIGVVGEIFCRFNTFSNEDLIRRVERLGGECWLSHATEWLYYTNWARATNLQEERDAGARILSRTNLRLNLEYWKQRLKDRWQHKVEHALFEPVAADLKGYEEPHDVREILEAGAPYLPAPGAQGEMVLSVGKTVYLYGKGADGVIDISPFTCMNGIVCEAVYPAISADHDNMPIRVCYFDKTNTNIDRELEIFLDLARAYQARKQRRRVYPDCFT